MSGSWDGRHELKTPGLLQPGVVDMLNKANPLLVSQQVLDRNGVTAETGVTANHLAVGARAGRILFHPALVTYAGDNARTVHRIRTGNPNCLDDPRSAKEISTDIFFSAADAIIAFLKDDPPVKQRFKDTSKRSKILSVVKNN